MGLTAVRSHEKGKSHILALKTESSSPAIGSFFAQPRPAQTPSIETANAAEPSGFVVKDTVTRAEVLWCLKLVAGHFSMNSCKDLKQLFQAMFPDSDFAKNFTLGPSKASYVINFGIGPYFRKCLRLGLQSCDSFVVCFDEAFNKIAQRAQMDILVRFWDASARKATERYLTSVFLERSRAEDLLAGFKESLSEADLPLAKLAQISMDGPNVNWKFVRCLTEDMAAMGVEPQLLEIGSCSLHVVHGMFQTGHAAVKWKVNQFLSACYYLFKDSPARRAMYRHITGSSVFAKKFCSIRWTENTDVVDRIFDMLPSLRKYVNEVSPKPKVDSFRQVEVGLADVLLEPRLHFFRLLSDLCGTFLNRFQFKSPMMPFLYDSLVSLLQSLLRKFVKGESVGAAKGNAAKLLKMDFKSDSVCKLPAHVDIGFGASKCLKDPRITEIQRLHFRNNCKQFLTTMTAKLIERCPLKYSLTRGASFLCPDRIASAPDVCKRRLQVCLEVLVEKQRISAPTADAAKQQFLTFVSRPAVTNACREFVAARDRLDTFYFDHLGERSGYEAIWSVAKLVLILSHGNAGVESGFSVNEGLLVENMQEESLKSQRIVYDSVLANGGPLSVDVDKEMMQFVRSARSRYHDALDKKRRENAFVNRAITDRKRIGSRLNELVTKKRAFEAEAASTSVALQEEINQVRSSLDH